MWEYLDNVTGRNVGYGMLYSEHQDEVKDVFHAYDKNLKPKDYIESFVSYVKNNIRITSYNVCYTKLLRCVQTH